MASTFASYGEQHATTCRGPLPLAADGVSARPRTALPAVRNPVFARVTRVRFPRRVPVKDPARKGAREACRRWPGRLLRPWVTPINGASAARGSKGWTPSRA